LATIFFQTLEIRAAEYDAAVWGLIPDTSQDCTAALQKAVDELGQKPGSTLKLAPGVYHFHATNACQRIDYQSNTSVVSPRRYAIFIEHANGLTIDGRGATLMMHGEMSAIGVDDSEAVTLKNLNIDWDRLLTSQARVVEQGEDWQVIEMDTNRFPYVVENETLQMVVEGKKSRVWSTMEIDPDTGRNLGDIWGALKRTEEIAPGKLKIWGARRVEKVGDILALRHHLRSHAVIYVLDSSKVRIERTEAWCTCGLGILFQKTQDIELIKTSVRPRPGSGLFVGPKDDGFHFASCSGEILIDGCRVEGTPDDPVNIHGTFLPVDKQTAGNIVLAHFGEGMSIGQASWGKVGDVVSVVDRQTSLPVEQNVIKGFRLLDPTNAEVVFGKPLTRTVTTNQVLENLTDAPSATIRNCWFGNNRARGVIVKTPGKVVIENNTFANQGSAILIPGAVNSWYESGAVRNVLIRGNTFDNCLIAPTQFTEGIISIFPTTKDSPGRYFHRNIRIEQNTFRIFDRPILYAHNLDGLEFSGNTIIRTEFRPPWHSNHDAIRLSHCRDVSIGKNKIEGKLLSYDISHADTAVSELKLAAGSPFRLRD
jgi:hypothetical protein